MLVVNTTVQPSQLGGLGLFAAEDIPKGTVTWRFTPKFDVEFTANEIVELPESARHFLETYAYFHAGKAKYVLVTDNDRFINHSEHPNIGIGPDTPKEEGYEYALRDIAAGEELTVNYRAFDDRHDPAVLHTRITP